MDLSTCGSGSGRCIRVWIMVVDEASGCQGRLHTGPHIHPRCSLFNLCKPTLFTYPTFLGGFSIPFCGKFSSLQWLYMWNSD